MRVTTTSVVQGNRTLLHCDFHMEAGDLYPTFCGKFVEWHIRNGSSRYFKMSLFDTTGRLHTTILVEGKSELECFMSGLQVAGAFSYPSR